MAGRGPGTLQHRFHRLGTAHRRRHFEAFWLSLPAADRHPGAGVGTWRQAAVLPQPTKRDSVCCICWEPSAGQCPVGRNRRWAFGLQPSRRIVCPRPPYRTSGAAGKPESGAVRQPANPDGQPGWQPLAGSSGPGGFSAHSAAKGVFAGKALPGRLRHQPDFFGPGEKPLVCYPGGRGLSFEHQWQPYSGPQQPHATATRCLGLFAGRALPGPSGQRFLPLADQSGGETLQF